MRKMLLATLCVGLPALVASCSSDSGGGTGSTGGSSTASTSASQGGSSGKSSSASSAPTGGSSAPSSSSASGGSSSGSGGSGGSSTAAGSGGKTGTGGSTTTTSSSTSTGGSGTAGAGGGGSTSTGGSGTGGRSGTAGNSGGGTTSTGGSGTTSTGGGGTTSTGGSLASNNPPVPSKGCGKTDGAKTLTTGGSSVSGAPTTSTRLKGVTSGGKSRAVIVDIPADYDPTKPYRLIFSWRQMGGSDTGNATGLHPAGDGPNFDAEHYAYFGLRREALNAKEPVIFVAPDTDPVGGLWDYAKDSVYFDDLLALVTENLCIDESRVFTTGFSYGAMFSYTLSVGRATKLRAAVTMAPTNTVLAQPTNNHVPVAFMSTTGMSDNTCKWDAGGKASVIQHATDNGCTIPATIPETTNGSKKYVCYDFEGCKAGYPVKVCRFDGGHTPSSVDDGSSNGDDGLKAFIPPLAWKFIAQF